jgi:putative isomerase
LKRCKIEPLLFRKSPSLSSGNFSSSRRSFLAAAGAASLVASLPTLFAQESEQVSSPDQNSPVIPPQPTREELAALLKKLLIASDPKLYEFAVEVFAICVLGKIRPVNPPLMHPWIVPGGGYYAQWLWDTMFVVDLLALLPGQEKLIRGVFLNYWDFQERWNAVKPDFMHGMIANFIAPFNPPPESSRDGKLWKDLPAYSQTPLLAWGMERVYLRNHDLELLRAGLSPLEKFHEWYWRERDVRAQGLVGVGAYSGDPVYARYETYDREVDLDNLKMTTHPRRQKGAGNGPWYGDIAIPANTAYLLLSEQALSRMALLCGDPAMAKRRNARYARGVKAMRQHMWDDATKCFLAVQTKSLEKIRTPTVGGFMPLMAGVPTSTQAKKMADVLMTPTWMTPLPIPTVARNDAQFNSSEFWRGDVWPAPNFQVASGLLSYQLREAANRIADATVANALRVGISERYDSLTGAPLGVAGLGMSATILTAMLDGLTSQKYHLRVRPGKS